MCKSNSYESPTKVLETKEEIMTLFLDFMKKPNVNGHSCVDEDGFVDCMNIGKGFRERGFSLPKGHKWANFLEEQKDLCETKLITVNGSGTIRVVRLIKEKSDVDLLKEAYKLTPDMWKGWRDFHRFQKKLEELGLVLSISDTEKLVKENAPSYTRFNETFHWRKADGTLEDIEYAFRANELSNTVYHSTKKSAREKFYDFAYVHKLDRRSSKDALQQIIDLLATKVRSEHWYYGSEKEDPGNHPILMNYFLRTFERLQYEDQKNKDNVKYTPKIMISNDGLHAIFNTGLVDVRYTPVYALFKKNPKSSDQRKWVFSTFVNKDDKAELHDISRWFGNSRPERAEYYTDRASLVYDIKSQINAEEIDYDHIIENCERLPLDFLKRVMPNFDYSRLSNNIPKVELKRIYAELAEKMKEDNNVEIAIANAFRQAIKDAEQRVKWNFKTAIPIYYPEFPEQITLLLPLAFDSNQRDKIDVALAVENVGNGACIAHTILSLDMAYMDARLITSPDSDWLKADIINKVEDDDSFEKA